jgi:hypothetical protein
MYWISPASCILQTEYYVSAAGPASFFRWKVSTQFGPLERANPHQWTIEVQRIGPKKPIKSGFIAEG